MNKLLFILTVSFAFCLNLCAEELKWFNNFNDAKSEAAKENKLIFADFSGSDWCIYCKKLDKEILSTKEFKDFAEKKFVFLLVDFPQGKQLPDNVIRQNNMLSKMFDIEGYPTIVVMNKDGKELFRTGYKNGGAPNYIKHLETELSKIKK